MLERGRRNRCCGRLQLWASLLPLVVIQACGGAGVEEPPTRIVIAAGPTDGVFQAVGEALAAAYSRLPGIQASTRSSLNSQSSADAVELGEADLALEGARTSYLAYRRGTSNHPAPHTRLRALAVLFPTVVHIATRRDGGIRSVADLKGRRIYVGPPGSPTEGASRAVLESHRLTFEDIQPAADRGRVLNDFREGRLDGVFSPSR
jgi:TRAP transporter TAXI family solute receptor